jgi:hypothetical protein
MVRVKKEIYAIGSLGLQLRHPHVCAFLNCLASYDVCHDLRMGNCKIVVTVSVAECLIKIRYL